MTPNGDESAVLTGCGWVTPFAVGTIDEVLSVADSAEPQSMVESGHWAVPEESLSSFPDLSPEVKRDKSSRIAAVALEYACASASIEKGSLPPHRVGMVLGCALAGQLGMIEFATEVREQSPRFVSPIHFPQTVGNYPAGALARAYGIRGPNATVASGDASGLDAIAEACGLVAGRKADVVFAGGTDRLSGALAQGLAVPDRPTSDGACLFVVESAGHAAARGAKPLATVTCCARRKHDRDLTKAKDGIVLAGTSCRDSGAIAIERLMGRCPGSLGAASVAAAIGAVRGHPVPLYDLGGQGSVAITRIPVDRLRADDGTVRGVVFADTDDAHVTTVELTIPHNG